MSRFDDRISRVIFRTNLVVSFGIASALLVPSGSVFAQGWPTYGHDQQHTCQAAVASQLPQLIRWQTPVDNNPPVSGNGDLYIHYGSPVITKSNTVLVPVKLNQFVPNTTQDAYVVKAINGLSGAVIWTSAPSDFTFPSYNWVPIFGISITPNDGFVVYPGAGGTVYARSAPDSATGVTTQYAFVNPAGVNNYSGAPGNAALFNSYIKICTPISTDAAGNLYFGYTSYYNGSTGQNPPLPGFPNGIPSGLAKISNTGVGSFISAAVMSGDNSIGQKPAYNCAPAFSSDGTLAYVAVNGGASGIDYLCSVSTATMTRKSSIALVDPRSTPTSTYYADADDDGSGTPTVGPDGDVYYGVLAANINGNFNDYRGFLLHFDSGLTTNKLPSAFGWDDTPSVVPAATVPSYNGTSSYLLLTKYNNYADGGGTGKNEVAIVDPNANMVDPTSGVTVMKTVITVLGVTPDASFPNVPGAVREWCINSAAIDLVNKCAIVNSEDGHVYRWDFTSNTLSTGLMLEPPTGEAYTPTVIGPDGAVYAINNATLFSCIASRSAGSRPPGRPPGRGADITTSSSGSSTSNSPHNQPRIDLQPR